VTNHESDNFYAETLLKEITRKHHDTVVYDTCVVAEKGILAELGVDTGYGIRIEDGSGLSRRNYVSPDFFCRYLGALSKTTCFDTFLSSLPHPGGSGTVGGLHLEPILNALGFSIITNNWPFPVPSQFSRCHRVACRIRPAGIPLGTQNALGGRFPFQVSFRGATE
jgi:hypothetical protein